MLFFPSSSPLLLLPISLHTSFFFCEREIMVLGKRHGSLIKRTTSMLMITDDIAPIYNHASQPADHLTMNQHHHNPTVMMATNNDDDFLRTCSLCNRNLCHRRDIYMYRYGFWLLNQPFKYLYINVLMYPYMLWFN